MNYTVDSDFHHLLSKTCCDVYSKKKQTYTGESGKNRMEQNGTIFVLEMNYR